MKDRTDTYGENGMIFRYSGFVGPRGSVYTCTSWS